MNQPTNILKITHKRVRTIAQIIVTFPVLEETVSGFTLSYLQFTFAFSSEHFFFFIFWSSRHFVSRIGVEVGDPNPHVALQVFNGEGHIIERFPEIFPKGFLFVDQFNSKNTARILQKGCPVTESSVFSSCGF